MASFADQESTATEWVNAVAVNAGLSGVAVTVQNKSSSHNITVYEGGASAPAKGSGMILGPLATVNVNDTRVWVRGDSGFTIGLIETI